MAQRSSAASGYVGNGCAIVIESSRLYRPRTAVVLSRRSLLINASHAWSGWDGYVVRTVSSGGSELVIFVLPNKIPGACQHADSVRPGYLEQVSWLFSGVPDNVVGSIIEVHVTSGALRRSLNSR